VVSHNHDRNNEAYPVAEALLAIEVYPNKKTDPALVGVNPTNPVYSAAFPSPFKTYI
jgi:hypothetical protein